jgi:hypothetical protein
MPFSGVVRSGFIPKWTGISLALTALLVLSGCWVESINPLNEDDGFLSSKDPDVVFDPSLIGSWVEAGDNCDVPLTITAKDGVYDLQSPDKNEDEGCAESDKPSHYRARLVKLDNDYFLDLSPIPRKYVPCAWRNTTSSLRDSTKAHCPSRRSTPIG